LRSTESPTKWPTPFRSSRTSRMRRTIESTRIASGGSWCRRIASSPRFVRGSSASAARCTSSGAPRTWPSRGFRDGARLSIPVGFPISRTASRAKRIRTRWRAAGSGPAADRFRTRPSIRTRTRSRRATRTQR
jgi:hypothetical protein